MLFLKFYWFVRTAKWEYLASNRFFNKKKGFTLWVCSRSSGKVIEIQTGEYTSMEYGGFRGWLIIRIFKNIHKKIKRQEKKEKRREKRKLAKEIKENRREALKNLEVALHRQCYIEIEYDHERTEYKIRKWLEEKEYSFEKFLTYNSCRGEAIYYFENKDQATEFKMVWG